MPTTKNTTAEPTPDFYKAQKGRCPICKEHFSESDMHDFWEPSEDPAYCDMCKCMLCLNCWGIATSAQGDISILSKVARFLRGRDGNH